MFILSTPKPNWYLIQSLCGKQHSTAHHKLSLMHHSLFITYPHMQCTMYMYACIECSPNCAKVFGFDLCCANMTLMGAMYIHMYFITLKSVHERQEAFVFTLVTLHKEQKQKTKTKNKWKKFNQCIACVFVRNNTLMNSGKNLKEWREKENGKWKRKKEIGKTLTTALWIIHSKQIKQYGVFNDKNIVGKENGRNLNPYILHCFPFTQANHWHHQKFSMFRSRTTTNVELCT